MAWQALDVEWEPEAMDYVEGLGPSLMRDLFAAVDRYAEHGIADHARTWSSPTRIEGALRAEGRDLRFYIESVGGKPYLTIAEVDKA